MSKYNFPKNMARKAKSKLLNDVSLSLEELQDEVNHILLKQVDTENLIKQLINKLTNTGVVRMSDNEVMTKIFSGAKIYLDPRDVALVPHLLLDGEWEHEITMAWLKTVRKGDIVIDIGANFGYYGMLAAQQVNRDLKIIYFEANPNLISYIKKTVNVNSMDECSIIENLAITDKKGKVTLNILKDYIASSSLHPQKEIKKYTHGGIDGVSIASKATVDSITLDQYCSEHNIKEINLIKMDIEGFEDKAYEGMRKIIATSPNITMFVEFTREGYKNPKEFYNKMLDDFGKVYLIMDDGKIVVPKETTYEYVIGNSRNWVMPIFSKKALFN